MKNNLIVRRLLQAVVASALWAGSTAPVWGQAPPGWAWAKAFGGSTVASNEASTASSVGTDAANNVYVLGSFVGTTDFGGGNTATSAGETDVFLAKYTPAGALVWAQLLSGTGVDNAGQLAVSATGRCVITGVYGGLSGDNLTLPGGQVLVGPQLAGAAMGNGNYGTFPFVASFNAQGVKEWASTFSRSYLVSPKAVCLSATGTAYLSGWSRTALVSGNVTAAPVGFSDVYLASISPQGVTQWIRRAGLAGEWSGGSDPLIDNAGNLYWYVGTTSPGAFISDGQSYPLPSPNGGSVLLKISPQNRVVWARPSSSLVSVAGSPGNYCDMVGYDPVRSSLWFSADVPGGSTVAFGSGVASATAPANAPISIIGRIDTSGTVTWATTWATAVPGALPQPPYPLNIQRILSGPAGATTVVGQVNSDLTLMNTSRTYTGQRGSLLVARLNPISTLDNWGRFAAINANFSISYSNVTAAALDGQGNVYVTGAFPTAAQFGSTPTLLPSRGGGWTDGFLAKLDMATVTATRAGVQGLAWAAYPNPATGQVQLSGLPPLAQVRLLDGQGRLVRAVQTPASAGAEATLRLTGVAAGLYTLQVSGTAQAFRAQRLTVE